MKAHRQNHRDLLSTTDKLTELPPLLAYAREEFAKIPRPDRAALLAGLAAGHAPEPIDIRGIGTSGSYRGSAFIRGSRLSSHGW